jgi:hypothetical protein
MHICRCKYTHTCTHICDTLKPVAKSHIHIYHVHAYVDTYMPVNTHTHARAHTHMHTHMRRPVAKLYEEENTCMSYEEEDTYTHMRRPVAKSYEEEDTYTLTCEGR